MSDDVKGVFVRLPLREDQARTFLKESGAAWDECNGSSDGLACESGLLAIGTPVIDGELPTEVVRVREHRKDIELPWTYHKVPPSDQDASDYELEFDRLLTHKQALAKLAEKDAEIARLREALHGINDTAHNPSKTVWVRIEEVQKEAENAIRNLGAAP